MSANWQLAKILNDPVGDNGHEARLWQWQQKCENSIAHIHNDHANFWLRQLERTAKQLADMILGVCREPSSGTCTGTADNVDDGDFSFAAEDCVGIASGDGASVLADDCTNFGLAKRADVLAGISATTGMGSR